MYQYLGTSASSKPGRTTTKVIVATQPGREPSPELIKKAREAAEKYGAEFIEPVPTVVPGNGGNGYTNGNGVSTGPGFMGTRIPTVVVLAGVGILGYLLLKRKG